MEGVPLINFLFVKNEGEEVYDITNEAFKALESMEEVQARWVLAQECHQVEKRDNKCIYVFQNFTGEPFDHLTSLNARILGPSCIVDCAKNNTTLPKTTYPVFSRAMDGLFVCVTAVHGPERAQLYKKVEWMSGLGKKEFHETVTHLVAGEVCTKKYIVAANLGKKIMSPEWIDAVWAASKISIVRADSPQFAELTCPMFRGLVISVSGLDGEDRKQVKAAVEREGGKFSGEMKLSFNTHLIISKPRGQKYEAAKKWKLKIVTPKWVFESLEAGYCLDETGFTVMEDDKRTAKTTSTPVKKRQSSAGGSLLPDISTISVTAIDETAMTTMNMSMAPDNSRRSCGYEVLIEAFDMNAVKDEMFLDGCKIYLSGFCTSHLNKLRRIINMGGGTRLNQLNETVSHMVVGSSVDGDIEPLRNGAYRPHAVSVQWLLESSTMGRTMPEETYYALDLPYLNEASPVPLKKRRLSSVESTSKEPDDASFVRPKPPPEAAVDNMDDLMSQYLPAPMADGSSTMTESALVRAAEAGEAAQSDATAPAPRADSTLCHKADETADPDITMELSTRCLFTGKTFVVSNFDEEMFEEQVTEFITTNGGTVLPLKTRRIPDYGVVPIFCGPVDVPAIEVVTNAWVQVCVEENCLMPLDDKDIFQPLAIVSSTEDPLKGCVLSLSGLLGTEREVYTHICQYLGGVVQDCFVRRANAAKKLKGGTHLVAHAAEGSKYQAAIKWKIPVVSKRWIIACAKNGVRVDESKFLVDRVEDMNVTVENIAQRNDAKASTPARLLEQDKAMSASKRKQSDSTTHQNVTPTATRVQQSVTPTATRVQQNVTPTAARVQQNVTPTATRVQHNVTPTTTRLNSDKLDTPEIPRPPLAAVEEAQANKMITPVVVKKPIMKNTRVQALIHDDIAPAKPQTSAEQNDSLFGLESPSVFLNPDKPYIPKLDFTECLGALDTPVQHTPGGTRKPKRKASLELGERFAERIQVAVENSKRLAYNQDNQPMSQTPGLCEASEPFQNVGPLAGVIIAVSKKLTAHQSEYNNMAAALGADYRWTYDNSCTHFIFQGKLNDLSREFRAARDQKKFIVSPHWLNECTEHGCRVEESLFPHTYNPNLSLTAWTVTPARTTRRSARSNKTSATSGVPSKPVPLKPVVKSSASEKEESGERTKSTSDESENEKSNSIAKTEALVQDLRKLMASTSATSYEHVRRNSSRNSIELNETKGSRPGSRLSKDGDNDRLSRPPSSRSNRRFSPAADTQPEPSQMFDVGWEDTNSKRQQELLAPDLALNSESFSPAPGGSDMSDDEKHRGAGSDRDVALRMHDPLLSNEECSPPRIPSPDPAPQASPKPNALSNASPVKVAEPIPVQEDEETEEEEMAEEEEAVEVHNEQEGKETMDATPKFLFSGLSKQEKAEYKTLVEYLGGETLESDQFDPTCTHLIGGSPVRNEKFLGCMATGKWILHKSYLEACKSAGRFVEESDYEWGSPATSTILAKLSEQCNNVAKAAHYWRVKIQNGRHVDSTIIGAFAGWRTMLVTHQSRCGGFARLLVGGGAEVVATQPPYNDLDGVTHVFFEMGKINFPIDLADFINAGCHCLKPEYIAACLMQNPCPEPPSFTIPEARKALEDSSSDGRKRKSSGSSNSSTKRACLRQ